MSYRKMQWHPSRSSSFTMALGGGPWSLPLGSVFCLHVFRWNSPFTSTKLVCLKLQVIYPVPPLVTTSTAYEHAQLEALVWKKIKSSTVHKIQRNVFFFIQMAYRVNASMWTQKLDGTLLRVKMSVQERYNPFCEKLTKRVFKDSLSGQIADTWHWTPPL